MNRSAKKYQRLLLSLCLGLVFVFFLCACAPSVSAPKSDGGGEEEPLKEPENLFAASLNVAENLNESDQSRRVFRTVGRTFIRNGSLACDFTCTGIRFNALCKGEIMVRFSTTADCYFTLYVNGVRSEERLLVKASESGTFLSVASFAEYGSREITIVKQSQYAMAYCEIAEVEITGSFGTRPAQKSGFIEFYGDSVLNGSNIHTGGTSVTTSDGTLAYGYTAALSLNVDCNIIGRGGMGLYPKDGATDGMNEIWDLCGGTNSPNVAYYDFGRVPDAVVVELGINDCISAFYTDKRYEESIKEMVFNLRSVYGDGIKIIWCYGYHEVFNAKWDVAKNALDALNQNGSILFCRLPNCALPKENGGDGYHPDVKISQEMAAALSDFIRENIYK